MSLTTTSDARFPRPRPASCTTWCTTGNWRRLSPTLEAFSELMASRGAVDPDEDVLEDAVAFAGVSKFPGRVKCALLSWMAFKRRRDTREFSYERR